VDIRVKERLTGAVILVALIVLVVPELLSGPARRAGQPAAAADEPPLRSVTVELGDEARSSVAARTDGGAELAGPSRARLTPAPEESSAAQSSSSASAAQPLPQPAPPPASEPRSARSSAAAQTQHMTRADTHDAARAPAATHAPVATHARPPASAGWSVQVGSFESRERADRFVHRLRAAGFTAFVSESMSHGRKWYRVRVGPERDRVAARAMVVRLHSAGHAGSIIPP
jgi:DedD protein